MSDAPIDDVLLALRDVGLEEPRHDRANALRHTSPGDETPRMGSFRRPRMGVARVALALGVIAIACGGAYAVPATRAAVDDVYGALADWIGGDEAAAPGHPLAEGDLADPSAYVPGDGERRILAQVDGQALVAIRHGDELTFTVPGFGESATIDAWGRQIAGRKLVAIYPGRFEDDHVHRPLFGVAAASVTRVEVAYAGGGPAVTQDGVDGGFGVIVETDRRLAAVRGFDASGRLVAAVDLAPGDYRYCPASGCLPWRD